MIASTRNEADRPQGLLLWNYARFARDLDDSTYYKALLRSKRGIIIHSLTDPIPEGPYGRFVEILIDISNEEKRRQTSIDSKDGIRSIVAQGALPGVPPRGLKREPIITINPRTGEERRNHRWVPDPKYRARILKAFQMRAVEISLNEIQKATHLFSSINSYVTFFKNKIYMGTLEYGGMVFEKYCDPMVPREIWEKVQAVQAKFAQGKHVKSGDVNHPRRSTSSFLLSGLARCSRCGSPLFGHTSRQKTGYLYQSYLCTLAFRKRGECTKGRIPRPAFEHAVISSLTDAILKKENLGEMHRLLSERQGGLRAKNDAQREEITSQLSEVKRQLTNIANAVAQSGGSKTLLDRLTELETQKFGLEAKLSELELSEAQPLPDISTEDFDCRLQKIVAILQGKDEQQKRIILRGLIAYVDVEREEKQLRGTIYYYLPIDYNLPPEGENSSDPSSQDEGPNYVPLLRNPSGPQLQTLSAQSTLVVRGKSEEVGCTPTKTLASM